MKKNYFPHILFFILWMASTIGAMAQVPARGAYIPWTTYEAENMQTNAYVWGPDYNNFSECNEASFRKVVSIEQPGHYVQFTSTTTANTIVIRYSLPDAPGGWGIDATLSLYKNGSFVQKVPMTSRLSVLYGGYPWTNYPSAGDPKNFFDDVQLKVDEIKPGDVIKLQKDNGDNSSRYIIDLVDLELVAAPLAMPASFISITSKGAVANDQYDDTQALRDAINDAKAANSGVWIPAGKFVISGFVDLDNVTMRGAGMWHSWFIAGDDYSDGNRIYINGDGNNIHISDFAIFGKFDYRSDTEENDGVVGTYGTGSSIKNIWVEHTRVGIWVENCDGLIIEGTRIRNTIADGTNLCVGMRNTFVYNCTARGNGDDCFAVWPTDYIPVKYSPGFNTFMNCTGQNPWLAQGFGIYGGESNSVVNCVVTDVAQGSGVIISTTFPAYPFTGTTVFKNCDIIRSGGDSWPYTYRAGLQIMADRLDISGVWVEGLDIIDAPSEGIKFTGNKVTTSTYINDVTIVNPGRDGAGCGILEYRGTVGAADITNVFVINPVPWAHGDYSSTFNLIIHSMGGGDVKNVNTYNIPCKIESEGYSIMAGMEVWPSSDIGGGNDLGMMDAGDYLEYPIDIQNEGLYSINFRVASTAATGEIKLLLNDAEVVTVDVPYTGGYDQYTTITTVVKLPQGKGKLRMVVVANPFIINWIDIQYSSPVAVTGVNIKPISSTVYINGTTQLTATVLPDSATNKNVTWLSSNTTVATIDANGNVTGKKEGTTNIIVTTVDGGFKDTLTVVVFNQPVTGVSLTPKDVTLEKGVTSQLTITLVPASNQSVVYTSDNTTIASVSNSGLVTANATGTATIYVTTTEGNFKDSVLVSVFVKKYKIVNKWKPQYLYDSGDRVRYGTTPTDQSYEWTIEDFYDLKRIKNVSTGNYMHIEDLLGYVQCGNVSSGAWSSRWTIDDAGNGYVRFKNFWQYNNLIHVENQQGQAQYSAIDPSWDSPQWELEAVTVKTTALTISPVEKSIKIGTSLHITPAVTPIDAANKNVTYSTSNAAIATVDINGLVTGVGAGSASIVVTTVDGGFTDTCIVSVTANGSQLIPLAKGWNLVSFNLVPADSSIASIFGSKLSLVQEIKDMQSFYSAVNASYLNSLTRLLPGEGYLVKMSAAHTLEVTGTEMPIGNLSLKKGWNLAGCPFQTKTGFEVGLVQQGIVNTSNLGAIKNFDGFWVPSGTTNSIDSFEQGKGYFILQK